MKFKKWAFLALSGAGLFSVASVSASIASVRERKKIFRDCGFWVIAHRGYSGLYPENTMLAFQKATLLPIDAIELDVRSTRDGKVVVIHDDTLDRTTDRSGHVLDFTWEQLRKFDAGHNFDPQGKEEFPFRGKRIGIPLLEEVFKRFPEMNFIIEIKQTMPPVDESVYRLIRKYRMEEKVIVASEHQEPLSRIREIAPAIATNFSKREAIEFYAKFRMKLANFHSCRGDALQVPDLHRGTNVITRNLTAACKRKGLLLHIWTVNDEKEMQRLMDVGVDGIITDYPDRLLKLVGREEKQSEYR